MSNSIKHTIQPEGLEHLLKKYFLELDFTVPKNEVMIQAIGQHVIQSNAYSPTHNYFKKLFTKESLLIASFVFLSIATWVYINNENIKTITKREDQPPVPVQPNSNGQNDIIKENITSPVKHNKPQPSPAKQSELHESQGSSLINNQQPDSIKENEICIDTTTVYKREDTVKVLPSGTKKEIKHNIQKKKNEKAKWREHEVKYDADHFY